MTTILNKISAMRFTPARFFGFWAALFALVFTLSSCSDDLDVQQSYPFTVEVMPFAEKIVKGRPWSCALRSSRKATTPIHSTLYAISNMTVRERSNSLTAQCW